MMFVSDNWSGVAPEISEALAKHGDGMAIAYGDSELDRRIEETIARIFECECDVYFVGTGTAANSLASAAVAKPGGVVFCHDEAHVVANEGGAPEFFTSGNRLKPVGGDFGMIDPEKLEQMVLQYPKQFNHLGQGTLVTLTQSTEAGTIYSPSHIQALTKVAKANKLAVHMDGARFANALVELECTPAEMTWKSDVDMVSFGGTKNGCWCAEALLVFNPELSDQIKFLRKRMGHLFSKTRFISAQFEAYFKNDLWLRLARHSNAMGKSLANIIRISNKLRLAWPTDSNQVFVVAERAYAESLMELGAQFYPFPAPRALGSSIAPDEGVYRMVTSFSSSEEDLSAFEKLLK